MTLPDKPNSLDRMRNLNAILRRHQIKNESWMDVKVRLEPAQGIRRVWIHLIRGSPKHVNKTSQPGPPPVLPPSRVFFESYLDPFGHDRHGREKYRLRRRLAAPINPHDFEVNRRRDQAPYPHEVSIEVAINAADEKEVRVRRNEEISPQFNPVSVDSQAVRSVWRARRPSIVGRCRRRLRGGILRQRVCDPSPPCQYSR